MLLEKFLRGNIKYTVSRNRGQTLGIFYFKMNNGIDNRFLLLYYICNKVQFTIRFIIIRLYY